MPSTRPGAMSSETPIGRSISGVTDLSITRSERLTSAETSDIQAFPLVTARLCTPASCRSPMTSEKPSTWTRSTSCVDISLMSPQSSSENESIRCHSSASEFGMHGCIKQLREKGRRALETNDNNTTPVCPGDGDCMYVGVMAFQRWLLRSHLRPIPNESSPGRVSFIYSS